MNCRIITDDTLRETIRHGNSGYPFAYYPENIWQFDFHRIDWHWHHELELLYAARGSVVCLVGTERIDLQEGQGIFINSGSLHMAGLHAGIYKGRSVSFVFFSLSLHIFSEKIREATNKIGVA